MSEECRFSCPNFNKCEIAGVCPASALEDGREARQYCLQVVNGRRQTQDLLGLPGSSGLFGYKYIPITNSENPVNCAPSGRHTFKVVARSLDDLE